MMKKFQTEKYEQHLALTFAHDVWVDDGLGHDTGRPANLITDHEEMVA